jgi:hypothetical protein
MAKHPPAGLHQHQKEFINLVSLNSRRYRTHEVFRDFCELAALTLSNVVDLLQREEREARYMSIVARYEPQEIARFPQMLAVVTMALETEFHDCLGQLFMALELGDHWKGQFFTPYHVSYVMANLTLNNVTASINERGFFSMNEPTVGAGAMVIATAQALLDKGQNYQRVMHVTAQDIDQTAVHMCYIQMSLLHIPGVVILGNSLSVESREIWYTPAHILGGWSRRLANPSYQAEEVDSQHIEPPSSARPIGKTLPQKQLVAAASQLDLFA